MLVTAMLSNQPGARECGVAAILKDLTEKVILEQTIEGL
jgi:hypothetical protein